MKSYTRYLTRYTVAAVFAAGVFSFVAAPAEAERRGPRASVLSSTQCALDLDFANGGADLVVTTTLTNKSSGSTIPEVRAGSMIHEVVKSGGPSFTIVSSQLVAAPQDVNPSLTLTATFDLCNPDGTVDADVEANKALGGVAIINYGISGGNGETRTVANKCTADEDGIGGGIKIADVLGDLRAACAALVP